MNKKTGTKRALLTSVMALAMCVVMLVGTTFAWFTDTATANVNTIQSGTLKIRLENKEGEDLSNKNIRWTAKNKETNRAVPVDEVLWEPGCTFRTENFWLKNDGNLAVKYKINLNLAGDTKLLEVLEFSGLVMGENVSGDGAGTKILNTLDEINGFEGYLDPKGIDGDSVSFKITAKMKTTAGNEYQGLSLDNISVTVYATQAQHEYDSTRNDYDAGATYPVVVSSSSELNDALTTGGTITVGSDIALGDESDFEYGAVLDGTEPTTLVLNGTVNSGGIDGYAFGCMRVKGGASLTVSANENGKFINTNAWSNINVEGGKVRVDGGYFKSAATCFLIYIMDDIYNNGDAALTINGGTFEAAESVIEITDLNKATVIINGGTFKAGDAGVIAPYPGNFPMEATVAINGGTFYNWDPSTYVNGSTHTVTTSTVGTDTVYTVAAK